MMMMMTYSTLLDDIESGNLELVSYDDDDDIFHTLR